MIYRKIIKKWLTMSVIFIYGRSVYIQILVITKKTIFKIEGFFHENSFQNVIKTTASHKKRSTYASIAYYYHSLRVNKDLRKKKIFGFFRDHPILSVLWVINELLFRLHRSKSHMTNLWEDLLRNRPLLKDILLGWNKHQHLWFRNKRLTWCNN